MFELESHRAFGAQIAAVFAQDVAHFGYGAHFVIGHGVHNNGCATYAVALVANFFVADAFKVTAGFVDVVFNAVSRHVGSFGFINSQAQARVGSGIRPALTGCNSDFADDARPDFSALFVLPAFTVLDIGPFTMPCHDACSFAELGSENLESEIR